MSEAMIPRQPKAEDTERAILSCVLAEPKTLSVIDEQLVVDDFYNPSHQYVFQSMRALSSTGTPIDYQTLVDQLEKDGKLEVIGGAPFVYGLGQEIAYASSIENYVAIVKEKSSLRHLLKLGGTMQSLVQKEGQSAASILEIAEQGLLGISDHNISNGLMRVSDTIGETISKLADLGMNQGSITGVTTGFKALDEALSGLQNSDLILIAARPSMGKTALGVNIGFNAAKAQKKVAVFSCEMSKLQLNQRLISMASSVDLHKLVSGDIKSEWEAVLNAVTLLEKLDLYIDDTSSISIAELRSKCRRMKMESGLDLVIIDYLQLMTVDDMKRNANREQEIATISRGLKALAKEMNCPVIALSQLSRKAEESKDRRPMMSDMRESGAIEQDADVVMLLYREDYYNKETERPNITDIIIAKHRNGPTGVVELYFAKEQTKFGDVNYVPAP